MVISVVDLKVIKAAVEVVVDKFLPPRFQLLGDNEVLPQSRIDTEIGPSGDISSFEEEEIGINPFTLKKVKY